MFERIQRIRRELHQIPELELSLLSFERRI